MRPLARRVTVWAMLAETVPLYPLYALLFAHAGLSEADISVLFAIWSATGILAEIPFGALADRVPRRAALAAGGVLQALGYALWMALPGFPGFAAGFVCWGLGGALVSGTFEALLYDGLAAVGSQRHFPAVLGRVTAVQLLAQVPTAVAATLLYTLGGYDLVGWVSVGCCLAAAAVAARLPEPPRGPDEAESYLAALRDGLREVAVRPAVRLAAVGVAALAAVDAVEEYFSLLAKGWGVPTAWTPVVILAIPLVGAAGAALGGPAGRVRSGTLALLLGVAAAALGAAGTTGLVVALPATALFYGLYRLVLVVAQARLQEQITGTARATVTSAAGLGSEVAALGCYAAWGAGGSALLAVLLAGLAVVLPRLVRAPRAAEVRSK